MGGSISFDAFRNFVDANTVTNKFGESDLSRLDQNVGLVGDAQLALIPKDGDGNSRAVAAVPAERSNYLRTQLLEAAKNQLAGLGEEKAKDFIKAITLKLLGTEDAEKIDQGFVSKTLTGRKIYEVVKLVDTVIQNDASATNASDPTLAHVPAQPNDMPAPAQTTDTEQTGAEPKIETGKKESSEKPSKSSSTFSIDLTKRGATLFGAFKDLTVGRTKNQGTLDVVMKDGKPVELKCSHHRFYHSSDFTVPPQEASRLRSLLRQAIHEKFDQVATAKLLDLADSGVEENAKGKWKQEGAFLGKFLDNMVEALTKAVDERMSITGDSRLLRADIAPIIEKMETLTAELKEMDIDTLLDTPPSELVSRSFPDASQPAADAEPPVNNPPVAPQDGGSASVQQSTGGDEKISEQPKTETTAEQPKTDAAQVNGPGQSVGDAAKTEGASTTSKVESKAPESKELQDARAYMKKKDEELAKKLADLKGASFLKKTEVLSKFIKACFDDKVFRKNAALVAKAENYTLMKSDEIKIVQLNAKGLPVLGAMRKQQFLHADGSTDKVAAEYYDQYGKDGKNICSQDFADATLTFGGIFQNWTTQEEVLFRQAGLAMFGALFQDGHELTEPRGLKEYVYTRNEATGRPNVETFTGCILNH